jgi:hypothetical protein
MHVWGNYCHELNNYGRCTVKSTWLVTSLTRLQQRASADFTYVPFLVLSIPIRSLGISTSACNITNMDSVPFFWSFWLPVMLSETVLCALVVIRTVTRVRERGQRRAFSWTENGRELIMVLVRDSILYFLV